MAGGLGPFYHGSREDFDEFTLEHAGRSTDRASNGALGVWCTPYRDFAAEYAADGGVLYEIMAPDRAAYHMTIDELRHLDNTLGFQPSVDEEVAAYDAYRRKLIRSGYGRIDVYEVNGSVDNIIILEPEAIEIVARHRFEMEQAPAPAMR